MSRRPHGAAVPAGRGSRRARPRTIALRSRFSVVVTVVSFAFAAVLVIDAVLRGAFGYLLIALPWLALVVWIVYVLLLRPCVIVSSESLTIVNVFRRHTIGWEAIEDLTSRFQLAVHLSDGRRIVSWGAPSTGLDRPSGAGIPVPGTQREPRRAGQRARTMQPSTATLIEHAHAELRESGSSAARSTTVSSVWESMPLVVSALLLALCALDAVVALP